MKQGIIILFLVYQSWIDLRKKQICLWLTGILGICGLIYSVSLGRGILELMLSLGIGILFLGIGILTQGALGLGDGWILISLGTVLGIWEMVCMVSFGLILAALWALALLVIKKKSRKTELPLVPFLLIGYLGVMLL